MHRTAVRPRAVILSLVAISVAAAPAGADTIVQKGFLEGSAGPVNEHVIDLAQFDPLGGTRTLVSVRLDFTTMLYAESVTNGGGGMIHCTASLWADYAFADGTSIAPTSTAIDVMTDNTGKPVATLYLDIDEATVEYGTSESLAPWIGAGTISLGALAQLTVGADPDGVIEWFASGQVGYVVTYEFTIAPECPADLNQDGIVDSLDLAVVLDGWSAGSGDVTGDGTTDAEDLAALLAAWGGC